MKISISDLGKVLTGYVFEEDTEEALRQFLEIPDTITEIEICPIRKDD